LVPILSILADIIALAAAAASLSLSVVVEEMTIDDQY